MEKTAMKIDNVLDDVVLLVLDGHDPLKELGIEKNKITHNEVLVNAKKSREIFSSYLSKLIENI